MLTRKYGNFDNKDNKLVAKVNQEFESYKQTFFGLIDKAQEQLDQLESWRKTILGDESSESKILQKEYDILSDLIKNYKQLVDRYVVDLDWC